MSTIGLGRAQQRLLDDQIEPFLQHLRDAGYAERTLRKKRSVCRAFVRWVKWKGVPTVDLNDRHVDAFGLRLPQGAQSRMKFEFAVVRLFLGYLRSTAGLQCLAAQTSVSSTTSLLQQYENHLRKARGLAENSLRVYLPLIRAFERSPWRGGRYASSKVAAVGFGRTVLATWRLGVKL